AHARLSTLRRRAPSPRPARRAARRRARRSLERAPSFLGLQRFGELVEVPVYDLVEPVRRQLDAMVGDAVLGKVVGADLLRTLTAADLRTALLRELRLLALALELVQACAQHPHRLHLVLKLRLLVLHRDDDAG